MTRRRLIPSSLEDDPLTAATDRVHAAEPVAVLPHVKVIKIGGQSIHDRGRAALLPLLDEIVAAKERHAMLLVCGGGTRARHLYSIASELELPTGILAVLGSLVPRQNARMIQMLLAKHGAIHVHHQDFGKLPLYFRLGCLPVMAGMVPFGYWEKPVAGSRVPTHRTDAGAFLTAEILGVPRVILVKDEDGLHENDPKKEPDAPFLHRIAAADLARRDLPDLPLERCVVDYLPRARFCREVQLVNGLVPGTLTKALDGDDVGTVLYA